MRRAVAAMVAVPCLLAVSGCAAPLGMAAAGLAGGAAQEAGSKLGRDAAGALIGRWLGEDGPHHPERCARSPEAEGCPPEALLVAYLERASPERREQVLAALPPELRGDMEARLYEGVLPAHGGTLLARATAAAPPAPIMLVPAPAAPAAGAAAVVPSARPAAAQAGDEEPVEPAAVGHVAGESADRALDGWPEW